MELKRVVVTGLGAVTPLGLNVDETWEALLNGVSGAGPITHFDASQFKTQFACEVKNFDPTLYLDKKEVRKFDRYAQFAVAAAKEAVGDSALDLEKVDKTGWELYLLPVSVVYGLLKKKSADTLPT